MAKYLWQQEGTAVFAAIVWKSLCGFLKCRHDYGNRRREKFFVVGNAVFAEAPMYELFCLVSVKNMNEIDGLVGRGYACLP